MRVLVAGGAGFIGSHLCRELARRDHNVICVDNFITGSKDNLLKGYTLYKFHETDIKRIEPEFDSGKIDLIFNLACPASPSQYQHNPIDTMLTNVLGTKKLLFLALANQAKFIQASTSEVYGDPEVHPQVETYNGNASPIGARACYVEGKRAAEGLCMDHNRSLGLDIRIARIFNTYGPAMNPKDGRVIPNFLNQALKNEPLTIYGNGLQTRSFCYVSDMVGGLLALANYSGPERVFNLGNPAETTMRELAELVVHITGSKSDMTFCDLPEDDPKRRKPDITRAKEHLNWEPIINLEDGIKEML